MTSFDISDPIRRKCCKRVLGWAMIIAMMAQPSVIRAADLFVSSPFNGILKYDGTTGAFVKIFVPIGSGGLSYPQGLTLGPNGNLFVCSTGGNQAKVLEYDGTTGAVIGAGPFVSSPLTNCSALAFGPNGNLFVDAQGIVYEFDGSIGASVRSFTAPYPMSSGINGSTGLAFGSNGHFFVGNVNGNTVVEFDVNTGFIKDFVPQDPLLACPGPFNPPLGVGGLRGPQGLTIGPNGNLFVNGLAGCNTVSSSVFEYDGTTGAFVKAFVPPGSGGLSFAWGLAFGPNGNLFVCSSDQSNTTLNNGEVLEYDGATGALVGTVPFVSSRTGPGFFEGFLTFSGSSAAATTYFGAPGSTTNPTGSFAEPVNTATGNYYTSHTDLGVRGRGLSFNFTRNYNSLDSYSGPIGSGWTHSYNILLTENSQNGRVTIKQGNGSTISFAPSGTGNYLAETKGAFDVLQKNADASFVLIRKNQIRLNFSSAGKLVSIVDRNGNKQELAYDSAGNLSSVTDTSGRFFRFSYDSGNRLSSIKDPIGRVVTYAYDGSGNLVSYSDALGGVTQYAYDGNHRMTSATDPRGNVYLQNVYDSQRRVTSQKNARGFTSTFAYDTPSPGTTTVTDARGNNTQHVYDSLPRLIKIINAQGGITSFTYDVSNNRTSLTDASGKTTALAYDSHGNLTSLTDAAGNKASFTYDAENNPLTATDRKANTTSFSYDASGNLASIRDALGGITTFAYDSQGQPISRENAVGNVATYGYDPSGNLVRITNGTGNTTALGYDGISRLFSITDGNGNTTSIAHDALSRRTKITGAVQNETQFAYDGLGNLVAVTDANGNAASYAYDSTNNLVKVTDALGHITQYGYDADNNRISFTDPKGHTTSYAYDSLNRRISLTDPLFFIRSYAYDSVGRIVRFTDAKGQNTKYVYDSVGRLNSITYADGSAVSYSYDTNGNRISMVDSHGATSYTYDALNRLLSVIHPGGKVVQYAYNALGQRQTLTYPDGKVVRYGYDSANRLSAVTDWLGRTTSYTYDAAGSLLSAAYPNGGSVGFGYDAANRLIHVQNMRSKSDAEHEQDDARRLASFQYVLDAVGNRVKSIDDGHKATLYAYDNLYRLTSVKTRGEEEDEDEAPSKVYTYDAVGNRLSTTKGDDTTFYSYDADDRLLSANFASFTYDANGNQTSSTRGLNGVPIVYMYNAADRLIAVTGGRISSSFDYDGDGNRISHAAGNQTFNYLNDIANSIPVVLQEQVSNDIISYVYGRRRISESGPVSDFFYHYDGIGSVVGLTNADGELNASFGYDAWGQSVVPPPGRRIRVSDTFRFTGEALDPDTELYYLRARYYDPAVGQFISRDALPGISWSPTTTNRYVYARGNPLRFVDPSGYVAEPVGQFLGTGALRSGAILGTVSGFIPTTMPGFGFTPIPQPSGLRQLPPPSSGPIAIDNPPPRPDWPQNPYNDCSFGYCFPSQDFITGITGIGATSCGFIDVCSAADNQAPVGIDQISLWNTTPDPWYNPGITNTFDSGSSSSDTTSGWDFTSGLDSGW